MAFLVTFDRVGSDDIVMIEDDGKVCYAYYLREEKIVGDVWLYNCGPAPDVPEWLLPGAKERMPFTNPKELINFEGCPIADLSEIDLRWGDNGVSIYFRRRLHAILNVGEKPGRCKFARTDGPVARRLALE